jgi:CheY-like chemotaxis protein
LREDGIANDAVLIALTGYGQNQDHARSKAAGFDHHLVKPAGALEITSLLTRLARRETGAREEGR